MKDLIPEFDLIQDADLRSKTIAVWEDAFREGGWTHETLVRMPCSLYAAEAGVTFLEHVRTVCKLCVATAGVLQDAYGARMPLNRDYLIAGALLADVGKLIEYECKDGKYQFSARGQHLRHPFSGAGLCYKRDIPEAVIHIVATHSKEGDHVTRSKESIIFHHADFIDFDLICKKRPF